MRLGQSELILLLALAILLFGTTRISGLGKALGKSIREFKEEVGVHGNGDKGEAKVTEHKMEN